MAKKKSKKKAKKMNLIISSVGAVLVIAVIVIIGMMFVTPDETRLKASYEKKNFTSALLGEVDGEGLGGVDASLTGAFVSIGSESKAAVYSITYYTTSEDAKAAYTKAKADAGEDVKVIKRGKAVYVGSKSCSNVFRFQIA